MAQQKEEEWIGLREFARRVKVNVNAVQKGIANGRIERREADKKIHWPSQKKAWDGNLDASKVRDHNATAKAKKAVNTPISAPKPKAKGKPKPKAPATTHEELEKQLQGDDPDEDGEDEELDEVGPGAIVLNYEKARKERATADLKEMDVRERRGELVQQIHVKSAMVRFAVELRDAILDIPDRVAAGLTAELLTTLPQGSIDTHELERIVLGHWNSVATESLEKLKRVHG